MSNGRGFLLAEDWNEEESEDVSLRVQTKALVGWKRV
jgi:hypothetical protein